MILKDIGSLEHSPFGWASPFASASILQASKALLFSRKRFFSACSCYANQAESLRDSKRARPTSPTSRPDAHSLPSSSPTPFHPLCHRPPCCIRPSQLSVRSLFVLHVSPWDFCSSTHSSKLKPKCGNLAAMDRTRPSDQLNTLLGEFLEVAITMLLSVRGAYPAEIFERRRYLNVPVQWARHAELREYINSCVTCALPWIQNGLIEKLAVVFKDKSDHVLETYTFELRVTQEPIVDLPVAEIEYALRAFFLKLSMSSSLMKTLPPEVSWEIVIFSKQLPGDADGKGHFWVPAEAKFWDQPPLITPIKSMSSKHLDVQLYIEHPS